MIELSSILKRISGNCKLEEFIMRGKMEGDKGKLYIKYTIHGTNVKVISESKGKREMDTYIYTKFVCDSEYKDIDVSTIINEKIKIFRPIIKITKKYKIYELIKLCESNKFELKKKYKSKTI